MVGRGRSRGRGRGRLNVGSERVTQARSRRELTEIPELSSEDSSYNPSSLSEGSIEVSLTDSDRVVVEAEAEFESEDRDVMTPVREPDVDSGSGGNVPVNATVDLQQFFNQMGEHMDRHLNRLSEHNRELLSNVANREVVQEGPSEPDSMDDRVLKVLRELRGFPDTTFKGNQDPAVTEEWLSEMEFRFDSLGATDAILMAKVAPNLFSGSAVQW